MDESYFGFSVAGGGVESPAEETEEDEVESGPGGMSPLVGYGLPLGGVDETKNTEDEQLMVLPPIGVADTKDKVSGPPVLPESALPTLTALDELLAEMGYLGDMIN